MKENTEKCKKLSTTFWQKTTSIKLDGKLRALVVLFLCEPRFFSAISVSALEFLAPDSRRTGLAKPWTPAHGLFLKLHLSPGFNRQGAKNAKIPKRNLPACGNIDFVGLGELGALAVKQIGALQEKAMATRRFR